MSDNPKLIPYENIRSAKTTVIPKQKYGIITCRTFVFKNDAKSFFKLKTIPERKKKAEYERHTNNRSNKEYSNALLLQELFHIPLPYQSTICADCYFSFSSVQKKKKKID